jgi:hypothetical protein
MSWYVVTCRLAHDDEDSCLILQADSWQAASSRAERTLRAYNDEPDDLSDEEAEAAVEAGDRREFYLNYAVRCPGEEKPVVEMMNGCG